MSNENSDGCGLIVVQIFFGIFLILGVGDVSTELKRLNDLHEAELVYSNKAIYSDSKNIPRLNIILERKQ